LAAPEALYSPESLIAPYSLVFHDASIRRAHFFFPAGIHRDRGKSGCIKEQNLIAYQKA
jgi:hypothetical protein